MPNRGTPDKGRVAPPSGVSGAGSEQVPSDQISDDESSQAVGFQPDTAAPHITAITDLTPVSLSWSQIETLQSCGEKYRLSRVLRAPRTPAWWFIGGSLVHEMTEYVDRSRLEDGHLLSDEEIRAVTLARLACLIAESDEEEPDRSRWGAAGSVKEPQGETWWAETAPRLVVSWRDWLETSGLEIWVTPNGLPAVELDMSAALEGGVVFRAIADRVLIDRNSHLVVDIKTGKNKPVTPFQLASQAVMIEATHSLRVDYGAFWMAREGQLTPPMDLRPAKERVLDLVTGARRVIDQGIFLPVVGPGCRPCGVRRWCSIMGGDPAPLLLGDTTRR